MKNLFCTVALILSATISFAQTSESLKKRIQEHYADIHAGNIDRVMSQHLEDISIFLYNGSALLESGWEETSKGMGSNIEFPKLNVTMKHFSSQIYDNVGIATFYLDGSYEGDYGLWRVTAVWVWKNGEWKEAHHHESRLKN